MKRTYLFEDVPFDIVTKKLFYSQLFDWMCKSKKKLVLNMNAYGVVTYLRNKKYAEIIKSADLIYPDGWGPVFVSKLLDEKLPERVNVGDFIEGVLRGMSAKRLSLYLLGSEESVVSKASEVIKNKYKGLIFKGFHNGFFTDVENKKILSEIRDSKPNLVLVGMGLPRQEYWIKDNWKLLPTSVYMGVGGVFNYIAGTKSRAPKWMRDCGLEWVYRFFQEPKRLGKRYTLDNLYFIFVFLKSLLSGKK